MLFLSGAISAAPQANKHLGVGSCASSVCHGKLKAVTPNNPGGTSRVALNEYRRWLLEDRHSQAYAGLQSPLARQIAEKMGIGNPAAAKICVDCHADNVPKAQRGTGFRLEDGVGCEACHGGAERWIKSHASNTAKHADNVALGMAPMEQPLPRAAVCLACHAGTADKFATHAMMGAGHPRFRFELETNVASQPAHYVVDDDYIARKGRISGTTLWLAGQLSAARNTMSLLKTSVFHATPLSPEFAFYDCDSCHHAMTNVRWTHARAGEGAKSGGLRLQTQNLLILQVVADALSPGEGTSLSQLRAELVRAGQSDYAAVSAASDRILAWIAAHQAWTQRQFTPAEAQKLRRALLAAGAADKAPDYIAAEQLVLSVQSLSYTLGDDKARAGALDTLFNALKSETNYNPSQFADAARNAQSRF